MTNKEQYKCPKCGTVHKYFDEWLKCCNNYMES